MKGTLTKVEYKRLLSLHQSLTKSEYQGLVSLLKRIEKELDDIQQLRKLLAQGSR